MANLLLIETATEICSIAVSVDHQVTASQNAIGSFQHATAITNQIQQCLAKAQLPWSKLDAVAISHGPGSYTGLRIGAAAAKAICYTHQIPLIEVSTLQAIAFGAQPSSSTPNIGYLPMIDARRMEVYTCLLNEHFEVIEKPQAIILEASIFDEWANSFSAVVCCGNGAQKSSTLLKNGKFQFDHRGCDATFLEKFAYEAFMKEEFIDVAYYKPFYLKPPNITKPKNVF